MSKKIVAVVGSYRRGGAIDTAVEAILEGARKRGASTQTVILTEKHIEFCRNCRSCVQKPGPERGKCVQQDDMESLLTEIETADAVVLASPVNFGNVTAVFRRFMERALGAAYWPWNQAGPSRRSKIRPLKAVLVASSGMPAPLMLLFTGAATALRATAKMLGAKSVGNLWIGLAAGKPDYRLSARKLERARQLGAKLAMG